VNPARDCERVRLQLMTALDGEAVPADVDPRTDARHHLETCASCTEWLQELESLNIRFQRVAYPDAELDLWATVEGRLRPADTRLTGTRRLLIIGALVFAWRALQLLIDLPFPTLHPLVPLAGAIAALSVIARDPLAIQTFAPELQKRGI
jgi:hypothetical protein